MTETFYDVMRRQGITRRSFLKFCSLTASALGLGPAMAPQIAQATETKPRISVLWLHGLECTCCSASFIRSAPTLAKDVILSMISLDYADTIMAAARPLARYIVGYTQGHEAITEQINFVPETLDVPVDALFSTLGRTAAWRRNGPQTRCAASRTSCWRISRPATRPRRTWTTGIPTPGRRRPRG